MTAEWKETKEFGTGYFRLWFLLKVYKIFGARVLKIVILPIVCVAFVCMGKARAASRGYFQTLYEHTGEKRFKPGLVNSFRHIYSFARSLVDKTGAWCGDIKEERLVYKTPEDAQRFDQSLRQGKGVFILTAHLGNSEILRAFAATLAEKITVNAFTYLEPTKDFSDFIARVNPEAGLNLYSSSDLSVEMAEDLKERLKCGELVVMTADRIVSPGSRNVESKDFLGKKAIFPKGPFRFMRLMEADFCFLVICENKNGNYDVYLDYFDAAQADDLSAIENRYMTNLQKLLLRYPYQWYNFYDFWT